MTGFAVALVAGMLAATDGGSVLMVQTARTCGQVNSCEEAVELWCGGYSRADADKDGIPCENICRTKEQVDAIRAEIGC